MTIYDYNNHYTSSNRHNITDALLESVTLIYLSYNRKIFRTKISLFSRIISSNHTECYDSLVDP